MIELRVLGAVEIRDDETLARPARRMARTLLGMLALRANRPVSVSWIIDGLWNGNPPRSANSNIRSLLADLRGLLPSTDAGEPRIDGSKGRYRLFVPPGRLDSLTFEALADEGSAALAQGNYSGAVAGLVRASSLWRGAVLDGLVVPDVVAPEAGRLTERRIDVLEDSVDARLALGQHRDLVSELTALTARYGPRERLWRQLMVVLYRCERQADALSAYQRLYQLLDAELGAAPGPATRTVHERILAADPDLLVPAAIDAPAPTRTVVLTRPAVPRQLPPEAPEFVGRTIALGKLDQFLAADADRGNLVAITGTAGVGKTALVLHWAHRALDRFPDGCLYVDLRGFSPEARREPAEVLATLLRGLGHDPAALPTDPAELAARYRTALADRRLLIVLDNARNAEAVRPLLPGSPSSPVLVTSRDDLAGLVARDGARRIELEALPADEAFALLSRLIGDRASTAPKAAAQLAERCVRLPLALRVAAELITSRDGTLAELLDELLTRQHTLDLLDAGGDRHTAVRAVFEWSYRALAEEPARAFRLLGVHPGAEVDRFSCAALLDRTPAAAQLVIDALRRAHLLRAAGPGRYALHDLLRAYAAELADPEPAAPAALRRLGQYYLRTAGLAMDVCYPAERGLRPRLGAPVAAPLMNTPAIARAWLDAELATMVAIAQRGPDTAIALARTLSRYLDRGAYHAQARALYEAALRASGQTGEAGTISQYLGTLHSRLDELPAAIVHLERALRSHRDSGDRAGEGRARNTLGYCAHQQGHFAEAVEHYQAALRCAREAEDDVGVGVALGNLALISWQLGRRGDAVAHQQQQLAIARAQSDRTGTAAALGNLGAFHVRLGRYADALGCHTEELALVRAIGDRRAEGEALGTVGFVLHRLDRHQEALIRVAEALVIDEETDNKPAMVFALNTAGEALLALGRPSEAALRHNAALTLAREIDDRPEQARALDALAGPLRTRDPGRARALWQQALTIYRDLGLPDALDLDDSAPALISIRLAELERG